MRRLLPGLAALFAAPLVLLAAEPSDEKLLATLPEGATPREMRFEPRIEQTSDTTVFVVVGAARSRAWRKVQRYSVTPDGTAVAYIARDEKESCIVVGEKIVGHETDADELTFSADGTVGWTAPNADKT